MKLFKDKVMIVTGASRGIGQAISVAFAAGGATVVGVARSDLAATASAVRVAGGQFITVNADLGNGARADAGWTRWSTMPESSGALQLLISRKSIGMTSSIST
jgi:NAD(P)-dependent dehydrogenase (short-subunit alcohol dehydrogenase family)